MSIRVKRPRMVDPQSGISKVVTLRLPEPIYEDFETIAVKDETTMSALARTLITNFVASRKTSRGTLRKSGAR